MHIVMERVLSQAVITGLYPSYVQAWENLLVHAAARHVLTLAEFTSEMTDARIEKHLVVEEDDGRILGLTTLTKDLSAIPWINDHFYTTRYPDPASHGTLFYIGYTFVHQSGRGQRVLWMMAREMDRLVSEARGVVGFDMCAFNNHRGIGRRKDFLFPASDRVDALDTQSYYTADYRRLEQAQDPQPTVSDPYRIVRLADRPELLERVQDLLPTRWPVFMLTAHPGHDVDLTALLLSAPEHQIMLLDERDTLCGAGLSIPLLWDGSLADLPAGWDDAVTRSATLVGRKLRPNTICALSITLASGLGGLDLGARMVSDLARAAYDAGATSLIAPVRPTLKARYPLVSMERYLSWRRDGELFDPWLRLHLRLGAKVLALSPTSMTLTGTIEEWEGWLDMKLPDEGEFVIPGGLVPLLVDTQTGTATYREPNVWVQHRSSHVPETGPLGAAHSPELTVHPHVDRAP
jgi:hypothetical protein